jgi:hypothetical protein
MACRSRCSAPPTSRAAAPRRSRGDRRRRLRRRRDRTRPRPPRRARRREAASRASTCSRPGRRTSSAWWRSAWRSAPSSSASPTSSASSRGPRCARRSRAPAPIGLPLWLVDRDLGVTLRRVVANVPWWQRATLLAGVVGSVVNRQPIDEAEIERLKEGDVLASDLRRVRRGRGAGVRAADRRARPLHGRCGCARSSSRGADAAAPRRAPCWWSSAPATCGPGEALEDDDPGEAATAEELLRLQRTPPPGVWRASCPGRSSR